MKTSGETKLLLGLAVFVLLGGGFLVFSNALMNRPPKAKIEADINASIFQELLQRSRHTQGRSEAPLTVIEFADFECPSCRRAYTSVVAGLEKNPKVRFAFHHLPLPNMHTMAIPAATAAEAAARQNKFWPMYNTLFSAKATPLSLVSIEQAARKIGLNMDQFRKDWKDPAIADRISQDMKFAQQQNVETTPTFFVRDGQGKISRVAGGDGLIEVLSRAGISVPKTAPPGEVGPQAPQALPGGAS